jgi:Holliday junction resolvase RusA-like endonuclease
VKFTIIIPPTGQMRARSTAFRVGQKIRARTHKHKKQEKEEERLLALLMEHRPPKPLKGPLVFVVRAFLPIPQSQSKKWKAAALAGQIAPEKTPDWDNLGKNLCDVMNGIFFEDDKQVVDGQVVKLYGDPARWEIEIRPWAPEKECEHFFYKQPDVASVASISRSAHPELW